MMRFGTSLALFKSSFPSPVVWLWELLDLRSHQDMGYNLGSSWYSFPRTRRIQMKPLLSDWDETGMCLGADLSGGWRSLLQFSLWSFLHVCGQRRVPLFPPSPHKQPKTCHKAPPLTLNPSFRAEKSSCLKEQAQDGVALIELPRQRFFFFF